MVEKASWRVSKQTSQLDSARSAAKGLWQDAAGRHVDARYLRPHSQDAATMASELGSQERDLKAAGQSRLAAAEYEKVAVREAHRVAEELVASEREVSLVYDFVTRSSSFENRAGGMQNECEALAAQAGTACSGIAAEGGASLRHAAPDLAEVESLGGAVSEDTVNSATVEQVWSCGVPMPGGRAYFHPDDKGYSGLVAIAKSQEAYSGEYTIMLHGNPREVAVGSKSLTPGELAAVIRRDSSWSGQPVRLLSCSTGADADGFARGLAGSLDVTVTAPTMSVWVSTHGPPFVGEKVKSRGQYFPVAVGTWRQFDPRP